MGVRLHAPVVAAAEAAGACTFPGGGVAAGVRRPLETPSVQPGLLIPLALAAAAAA